MCKTIVQTNSEHLRPPIPSSYSLPHHPLRLVTAARGLAPANPMAAAAVPNGHAAADAPPPSSSSLVFLGTGCSSAVPNARCLIQPPDPPCHVCSQSLSIPPELNPNYRCRLLVSSCPSPPPPKPSAVLGCEILPAVLRREVLCVLLTRSVRICDGVRSG